MLGDVSQTEQQHQHHAGLLNNTDLPPPPPPHPPKSLPVRMHGSFSYLKSPLLHTLYPGLEQCVGGGGWRGGGGGWNQRGFGGGCDWVPLCVPEDVFMGLRQPVRDGVECWT